MCGATRKHICRKMIELSLKIQNQAPESKEEVQGLIGETEVGVSELSSLFHPKSTSSVKGAITKVLHQFQEMITCDNPKSLFGITTGFDRMDNFTLGLRPQNVFIIGARPSVGKTTFMNNITKSMTNNSINENQRTIYKHIRNQSNISENSLNII